MIDLRNTHYEYDDAGNLIKDGNASYEYNAFNQTTKVETFDGNVQINKYDAEGLPYEVEENDKLVQFIFNHDREVVAEKQDDIWRSYIRESELLFSSAEHARTYYHYASDEMGSITHITDGDRVLNSYSYDAWGEFVSEREEVSNRFKFNGQQLDPITGQYYLRARYYNPVIGRFTQEDTYRGDGLNLYSYCRNNPVYYVDPTGHDASNANSYKDSRDNEINGEEIKSTGGLLRDKSKAVRTKLSDWLTTFKSSDEYINLSNTKRKKIDRKIDKLQLGNVAIADVNIPGIKKEFSAHSQIHSKDSLGSEIIDFSYTPEESKRIFKNYVVDEFIRYNDTEAKILEDIASKIKDKNISGEINLFTELDTCQSCTNIIFEFRDKYPNIKLNIFSNSTVNP